MGVVGHLPGVALGVDEDAAVAAPEGLAGLAADPRAGGASVLDRRGDLGRRAEAERQRHAAPAATVLDAAVLSETGPVPEGEDHFAGLEEGDVVLGSGAGGPADPLVESTRPVEVRDPEGDQGDSLFHLLVSSRGVAISSL